MIPSQWVCLRTMNKELWLHPFELEASSSSQPTVTSLPITPDSFHSNRQSLLFFSIDFSFDRASPRYLRMHVLPYTHIAYSVYSCRHEYACVVYDVSVCLWSIGLPILIATVWLPHFVSCLLATPIPAHIILQFHFPKRQISSAKK